jgi:hypothetical protein
VFQCTIYSTVFIVLETAIIEAELKCRIIVMLNSENYWELRQKVCILLTTILKNIIKQVLTVKMIVYSVLNC